jgi:large subunit ribosomal protein L24
MKSKFSNTWNKSVQPRKQRKYLANAPNHLKRKLLSAKLDKPLKEKHKIKSIEVRKNDEVKVMRGKYTKKHGKISTVDVKNTRVQIEGITIPKKDGETAPVWFHPSNLKIIKLDDSDNRRIKKNKTSKTETSKKEETKKEATPAKTETKKETPKKPTIKEETKTTKPEEK